MDSRVLVAATLLFTLPQRAIGWNNIGHEVIASLAYRQLSDETREKVILTLESHPNYEVWQQSFQRDGAGMDLEAYVFLQASFWPDEIRRHGSEFDHPAWHYVDYALKMPDFAPLPRPVPTNDLIHGIEISEQALTDAHTEPRLRAVYLSYLVHLIADLHQPLHCGSLYKQTYPMGDKGGNDCYIRPASKGIKLHYFWDGLLGSSGKPHAQVAYAAELESRIRKKALKELKKSKTPLAWSLEGREKAIEHVYLNGRLATSTSAENAPVLPSDYTKEAKVVAEHQAVLAGYRLADEITRYLK